MTAEKTIFLTGATGVVGGRLLLELLISTKAVVYCLSRDGNETAAQKRIAGILSVYGLGSGDYARYGSRVIPVTGDLLKPYLGLKPHVYKDLVQKADLVVHCAANVKLFSSYRYLKPINIHGTERIIRFCLSGDIPLVHVSTFAVLGETIYDKDFIFYESDLDVGQTFKDLDYARTKYEAETIVHLAGSRGLNWLIVRPGEILGDSRTGAYPLASTTVQGLFYEIFRAVIEMGYSPFSEENFDITPVDYVAKAILHLAFTPEAYGKTFHLLNPVRTRCYEIMNLLVEYGYRIRMIPFPEFVAACRDNRILRNGTVYDSLFTNMLAFIPEPELYEAAGFDTSATLECLKDTNIRCPEADAGLVATYLEYCIKEGYLPPPEDQSPLARIYPGKSKG